MHTQQKIPGQAVNWFKAQEQKMESLFMYIFVIK